MERYKENNFIKSTLVLIEINEDFVIIMICSLLLISGMSRKFIVFFPKLEKNLFVQNMATA